MTRTIPLKIENEYIVGDGVFIGAAGSHNDVVLRMAFSPFWDGLAKTVQFLDALNENPVDIILTADKLEDTDPRVYLVPVPYGAKAYEGRMSVAIRGVAVSGNDETRATLAVYGEFDVGESRWDGEGQAEGDVTPTQAEQLQAQYEAIMEDITDTKESAEIATTKAAEAKESVALAEAASGNATDRATDAEAWSTGQRNGRDVVRGDPAYHNNARYYSEQASMAAGGGVTSFNGRAGAVEPAYGDYTKADVGLGNVDNTSDMAKPVSLAQQAALDAAKPKISTVTLTAAGWTGEASPYRQEVTILGGVVDSKVDIQAGSDALAALSAAGVWALYMENVDGVFNAVLLGNKPTEDITIQLTRTEVGEYEEVEFYDGIYSATPSVEEQTLETNDKLMYGDVTLEAVPCHEVGNAAGGNTITIGG